MNTGKNQRMNGQTQHVLIQNTKLMSAKLRVPKSLYAGGVLLAFSIALFGQNSVTNQGGEFSILGSVPGDQVLPGLSLSPSGGCIVWQDNALDRKGGGIGASLLNTSFNAGQKFRVDKVVTGTRIKPQVQLLANDNMIFVWQGSAAVGGIPYIYARFAKNSAKDATTYGSNFYTSDIQVNTYTADQQADP